MFYNHTILTERKYGVATVWLVATLGSKSSLSKKLQKKDILEVDLPKACESIMHSNTLLALRLQSNLLYGVSRVFKEQYQYFFTDVQNVHMKINKDLFAIQMHSLTIDMPAGKSRSDNLLLPDDLAFTPELSFKFPAGIFDDARDPYIDQDLISGDKLSLRNARSRSRSHSISLIEEGLLPFDESNPIRSIAGSFSSTRGGGLFELPVFDNDDFRVEINESPLLQPDFEFDEDGNIRDIISGPIFNKAPSVDCEATLGDNSVGLETSKQRKRWNSESIASDRVRREHSEDILHVVFDDIEPFDPDIAYQDDKEYYAPSEIHANHFENPQENQIENIIPIVVEENSMSETLGPKKRAHGPKKLKSDAAIELRGADIIKHQDSYLEEQTALRQKKKQRRCALNAKLYAQETVFGWGGKLKSKVLAVLFSNDNVTKMLQIEGHDTGKKKTKGKGKKRASFANEDEGFEDNGSPSGRRVRLDFDRGDSIGLGLGLLNVVNDEPNFDNIQFDNGMEYQGNIDDDILEVGRRATPQQDSTIMPWNLPGRGSRAGSIFSVGGLGSSTLGMQSSAIKRTSPGIRSAQLFSGRKGFRVSASPIPGKNRLEKVSSSFMQAGSSELGDHLPLDDDDDNALLGDFEGEEEFEHFGAGANLETQEASQVWLKNLEREGYNFLEFIKSEVQRNSEEQNEPDRTGTVTFKQIIQPATSSVIVAAQALHHTLLLATRGLLVVKQDESFGDIRITPI